MTSRPSESFFLPIAGDRYRPTEHTASPWNPATQAGGAPAALLALLIERAGRPGLRSARATVDILGPIPLAPGRAHIHTVRQGRATEYLTGSWVTDDDREVLRIGVWRLAPAPALPGCAARSGTVDSATAAALHPRGVTGTGSGPEGLPDHTLPTALFAPVGYTPAMQWRLTHGGFDQPGPGSAWTRARVPVLPDVATPAMSRLLMAAATANGLGSTLDLTQHLAIDVDITVHLEREPTGPWLHMHAQTHVADGQSGHVTSTFHDHIGRVGRGIQTLLVARRTSSPHVPPTPTPPPTTTTTTTTTS